MPKLSPGRALRSSREEFQRLINRMGSMHTAFQVKPSDATTLIQVSSHGDSGDAVQISCSPVVCRVPERASHSDANIYVVFEGRLEIALDAASSLTTRSFATNFAYFDLRGGSAVHRLGGHYDYSLAPLGHPVTHLQLRSQVDYFPHVTKNFTSIEPETPVENLMASVLSGFRAPTAQVDFLGFLLQIGADHLIDDRSGQDVQEHFKALLNACGPVSGIARPNDGGDCPCAHSVHLYAK